MNNPSRSYRRSDFGEDCGLLNCDEGGPCWGKVEFVDKLDNGSKIYACEGHRDYLDWTLGSPYSQRYIPEPPPAVARHVAIVQKDGTSIRKVVLVPPGQSLCFDEDGVNRRWLDPFLGSDWHLVEFLPLK